MKLLRILAELNIAVVGLLFAWITFTGSARTVGMGLILWMSFIYIINEITKRDEEE